MTKSRFAKTLLLLAAVALGAVGLAQPAHALEGAVAAPSQEAAFIAAINQVRADHGLNALQIDAQLAGIARSWSFSMAAAGEISHRSDLRAGVTSDWLSLGENVGVGPTVSDLMTAFINSPGHFKNLVDPRFTHMGIGAVVVDGLIFTTHEFMKLDGAPASPATSPTTVRAQSSAPRPVTTTPRAPRTTAPRAATPAAPVVTPPPPPPPPTPAPRVAEVLDRLRGNPPEL